MARFGLDWILNILRVVSWAVTEALRIAVMGSAFIALIVIAMLGGQYLLGTIGSGKVRYSQSLKASEKN